MVYVDEDALRLKMNGARKRKYSQVVIWERRGRRGRQEGLGLVQTQRWEQFIVEMGAGDGGSLYGRRT